ncbi:MAG: NAD(P)H-hydrate dehydratase [Proteobacteria bacterium]|nr:NAD(P)H-hydrate dehydratase [Pseudomonadota bacterium]
MEALFTPAEMTEIDHAAPARGANVPALMENAGSAVARAIHRRYRPCRVLVLAGPGNNGGDGYVTARHLAARGWPVVVAPVGTPRPGSPAADAAAQWRGPLVEPTIARVAAAELVIDAIFGAGLARDITPECAALLAAARALVAIDMPSGVDGATGALRGKAAQAALTITFVARKPGHLLRPGKAHCGMVLCADIGMPAGAVATITPTLWRNTPALWQLPVLAAAGHKFDRGHLTILAGPMSGAAILAANAARRAGVGLLSLATETSLTETSLTDTPLTGTAPGIMIRTDPIATLLADHRRQVWLCGPGLGIDRAGPLLVTLIAANRTILADADALTACADHPERLHGVGVITPHEGEFSRVFPHLAGDKLSRARAAAAITGAIVVLKGEDTVIAAPDGRAAINDNAPPSLATAGSGDTLSGIIAGLLTQGMPAFEAACAGVWLHGAAAHTHGPGLIAEDLAEALPAVLATLQATRNTT